jgi:hypothetical protein
LLAQAENQGTNWAGLPAPLLRERPPRCWRVGSRDNETLRLRLHHYLNGSSWELIDWLAGKMSRPPLPGPFLAAWRAVDLETLRAFYLNGPRRNHRWRDQFGIDEEDLIAPEDLDDLPVKVKLAREPAPWPEADGRKHATGICG